MVRSRRKRFAAAKICRFPPTVTRRKPAQLTHGSRRSNRQSFYRQTNRQTFTKSYYWKSGHIFAIFPKLSIRSQTTHSPSHERGQWRCFASREVSHPNPFKLARAAPEKFPSFPRAKRLKKQKSPLPVYNRERGIFLEARTPGGNPSADLAPGGLGSKRNQQVRGEQELAAVISIAERQLTVHIRGTGVGIPTEFGPERHVGVRFPVAPKVASVKVP